MARFPIAYPCGTYTKFVSPLSLIGAEIIGGGGVERPPPQTNKGAARGPTVKG